MVFFTANSLPSIHQLILLPDNAIAPFAYRLEIKKGRECGGGQVKPGGCPPGIPAQGTLPKGWRFPAGGTREA